MRFVMSFVMILLVACAPTKPAQKPIDGRGKFKVTVKSGGQETGGDQLIHRYVIHHSQLSELAESIGAISSRIEYDGSGMIKGLQLLESIEELGLSQGDLLTAYNKKPARSMAEFKDEILKIKPDVGLSFTFERNATPHKTLVVIDSK